MLTTFPLAAAPQEPAAILAETPDPLAGVRFRNALEKLAFSLMPKAAQAALPAAAGVVVAAPEGGEGVVLETAGEGDSAESPPSAPVEGHGPMVAQIPLPVPPEGVAQTVPLPEAPVPPEAEAPPVPLQRRVAESALSRAVLEARFVPAPPVAPPVVVPITPPSAEPVVAPVVAGPPPVSPPVSPAAQPAAPVPIAPVDAALVPVRAPLPVTETATTKPTPAGPIALPVESLKVALPGPPAARPEPVPFAGFSAAPAPQVPSIPAALPDSAPLLPARLAEQDTAAAMPLRPAPSSPSPPLAPMLPVAAGGATAGPVPRPEPTRSLATVAVESRFVTPTPGPAQAAAPPIAAPVSPPPTASAAPTAAATQPATPPAAPSQRPPRPEATLAPFIAARLALAPRTENRDSPGLDPAPEPARLESARIDSARTEAPRPGAPLPPTLARQISEGIPPLDSPGFDLSLSPEELGQVRLRLIHGEGGAVLMIQAERPETLDLMRRHIGTLEQELRDLGHEGLELRFSGGGADTGAQQHPSMTETARPDTPIPVGGPVEPLDAPTMPAAQPRGSRDHLDLRL